MLDVFIDSIEDRNTREALQQLLEALEKFPHLKGQWKFIEINTTAAVTNKKHPHLLGFRPKDVIPLSVTNSATVTYNYDEFDETYIDITTTAATTIRAFVGTYRED